MMSCESVAWLYPFKTPPQWMTTAMILRMLNIVLHWNLDTTVLLVLSVCKKGSPMGTYTWLF